ncbi:MAG TPA: hypothetical protein GX739_03060 [Firmicutes bacterium]|nr:hypothetical protein [Bacillota bacterium]
MKQMLVIMLILALAAAAVVVVQRLGYEQRNRTVELVADLHGFSQFARHDFPAAAVLAELRQLGVESIGLREWTLGEKIAFGYAEPDLSLSKPEDWPQLLAEPVGFNPEELELVAAVGMRPVLLVTSNQLLSLPIMDKLPDLAPHLVIPAGDQVVGFPDRLEETKQALNEVDAKIGLVEFSLQRGINQVASADTGIRVHAITGREMQVLAADRVLSRYIRAVRERNIRVLYMRPFPAENGWDQTKTMITDLISELEANGFQVGIANPYDHWQPSPLLLWVVSAGILAGAVLLSQYWVAVSPKLLLLLLLLGNIAGGILLAVQTVLMQQLYALIAAIVFPVLAIANCRQGNRVGWNYLRCTLWSVAGLVLLVGILSGTPFLIKLAEFRGVKLMHLVPVVLVFAMGLLGEQLPLGSWRQFKEVLARYYHACVPVKYLLLLALAAVAGVVYLLRTANFILPIPQLEITLREGLERLLIVRPRFKEIFIGHPALVILLASRKRHPLMMSLAVIGQLSLVNTFTHVHTPLFISMLRTLYGLIIGYGVGWLVWVGYQKLKRRVADDPRFRLLRLP